MKDEIKKEIIGKLIEIATNQLKAANLIQLIDSKRELPTALDDAIEKGYQLDYKTLNCGFRTFVQNGTTYNLIGCQWRLASKLLNKMNRAGGNNPNFYFTGNISEATFEITFDSQTGDPIVTPLKIVVESDYNRRRT